MKRERQCSAIALSNILTILLPFMNSRHSNQHHDLPFVPGSRLPEVRRIAAEFYDPLPHHTSYCKVLWKFVFSEMTCFSRVKRMDTGPDAGGVQGFDPVTTNKAQ